MGEWWEERIEGGYTHTGNQGFTSKYPETGTGVPELRVLRASGVTGPRAPNPETGCYVSRVSKGNLFSSSFSD